MNLNMFALFAVLSSLYAGPSDVCEAVRGRSGWSVIRGVGYVDPADQALVMIDLTCPVNPLSRNDTRIPSSIVLRIPSSRSAENQEYLGIHLQIGVYYQIRARGKIRCKKAFTAIADKTGDMFGNGFGAWGLSACMLSETEIVALAELPTLARPRPAPTISDVKATK